MNQAEVTKLVSKLRVNLNPKPRRLKNVLGPEGRLNKLRKTITGLIKHERIELNYHRADEARPYAERLISEAIRHGDCHKPTMETADFWLLEKELIHKLFKVLVPRFENCNTAYTKLYKAPRPEYSRQYDVAILELRGNPYPTLINKDGNNRQLIQNILLEAAKYDYRQSKYTEMAEKIGKTDENQQSNEESVLKDKSSEDKTSE